MEELLQSVKNCAVCLPYLPLGVNPVISAHKDSKIVIVGQAPGLSVHKTGIPWNDPSGIRLREWLNISDDTFYDSKQIALIPMGFCYPGKGKSGDLPPRKECAPLWHERLFQKMPKLQLTILVGNYAQKYYLHDSVRNTLTETVKNYQEYLPNYLPLPHPSPRNNIWLKKNPWFKKHLLPELRVMVTNILKTEVK